MCVLCFILYSYVGGSLMKWDIHVFISLQISIYLSIYICLYSADFVGETQGGAGGSLLSLSLSIYTYTAGSSDIPLSFARALSTLSLSMYYALYVLLKSLSLYVYSPSLCLYGYALV
jgi:hypothetical protein